ncbi:MAG: hypothetical protein IT373_35875 [Polyangiaceae bacterium]|nr:hypothetical protein [Polyangiaceae bacterium]
MSGKREEDDVERAEREVAALFDASAAEPTDAELARAARAAAAIPDGRRRRRGLWHWLRRPGALGLAAALGAAAAAGGVWLATRAPEAGPAEPALASVDDDDDDLEGLLDELEDADLAGDDGADGLELDALGLEDPLAALVGVNDGPTGAIDLLFGPPEGVDLEAWAAAYDALLDEG